VFNPSSFPDSANLAYNYGLIGFGYTITTFRPEDKNEIQLRKCMKHTLKHESKCGEIQSDLTNIF
jgi:hypothetical protein